MPDPVEKLRPRAREVPLDRILLLAPGTRHAVALPSPTGRTEKGSPGRNSPRASVKAPPVTRRRLGPPLNANIQTAAFFFVSNIVRGLPAPPGRGRIGSLRPRRLGGRQARL